MSKAKIMPEEKKIEPIDFVSKLVKPHKKISRVVDESDLPRLMEDAKILYNLCYTQIGIHGGALAVAHSQITEDDPLRFFVTRDKEIIINPQIIRHTETTVDSEEGCVTFPMKYPTKVQRWNKCEVIYETLNPDETINPKKIKENLSGIRAKMFQHEINHCDSIYIFN